MVNNCFWISSVLFALVYTIISSPYYLDYAIFSSGNAHSGMSSHEGTGVLLLTAHPDDECMFFAPTLLALTREVSDSYSTHDDLEVIAGIHTPRTDVYSLCLSSGDADGLGETRKRELEGSLDVLGVTRERRWVLDEPFHDNITEFWDAKLIAQHVKHFIEDNEIDFILTFDNRGISAHPNHISLERGVRALLADSPRSGLRAFSLETTALLPKYTAAGAALFLKAEQSFCSILQNMALLRSLLPTLSPPLDVFRIADCAKYEGEKGNAHRAVFVSNWRGYMTALRAMQVHETQFIWFRWLYVAFSRYMWVNVWNEIVVDSD